MKEHSKYFSKNRKQFENLSIINLIEETDYHQNLTYKSIQKFIQFCQNRKIEITHSDVLHIRFLSLKYGVSKLTQLTNKHISKYYKEIIDEFLSDKSNIALNCCDDYEQIISENLIEFINERNDLLFLPLPSLYRILLRYSCESHQERDNRIIQNFLIEIIKKYGNQSAFLFENLQFKGKEEEYLSSIFHPYFDHVKNNKYESKFMKFLYDNVVKMRNEIDQIKKENGIKFDEQQRITNELKHEISKLKKENFEIKEELILLKNKLSSEIENNTNQIQQINQEIFPERITTINDFNLKSAKEQQFIISKIIKKSKNQKTKPFFVNVNNVLNYLIQKKTSSKNKYLEIKANDDPKEILMNIKDELPIVLYSSAINLFLSSNSSLENNKTLFKDFENVYFSIQYPSNSFDSYYNKIAQLKEKVKNIKIEIFISDIEETDMKFRNDERINSIVFDNTVKVIQGGAFFESGSFGGCGSLTNVEMPFSIESIGCFSLYKCASLAFVKIPSSVKSIGSCAFCECSSLKEIEIPPSITKIENSTFYGCKSLKIIKMPNSVNYIGESAFYGCSSLVKIEIPSMVTTIKENTFCECSSLKKIKFLGEIKTIESCAFYGCESLDHFRFSKALETIADNAFYGCSSIVTIDLPSSLKSIGVDAFNGCFSLKQIIVPASIDVKNIGIASEIKILYH